MRHEYTRTNETLCVQSLWLYQPNHQAVVNLGALESLSKLENLFVWNYRKHMEAFEYLEFKIHQRYTYSGVVFMEIFVEFQAMNFARCFVNISSSKKFNFFFFPFLFNFYRFSLNLYNCTQIDCYVKSDSEKLCK